MENKITLIVKATIDTEGMDSFNSYIEKLTTLFAKVNAEQIGYYPIKETFVGDDLPTFISIFKLTDREALNAVYETEEYKNTMIPLRNKGFKKLEVYLS
jgi:uncharacterized protein (DUF1330 family)